MGHIDESGLAQLEAMLAVAGESWEREKAMSVPIGMFLDVAVRDLPGIIASVRAYNEALRVSYTAMRHNNWHRIKDGRGLVPEPLTAEDAFRLVSELVQES